MITVSGSASPGGSTSRGRSVSRRSELVITPSFSGHCAAGSRTSAKRVVSVGWYASWTITSSAWRSAFSTRSRSGIEAAGLVAMIHTARTSPAASPSKISSAARPGRGAMVPGARPQWRSTSARASASPTDR